MNKKLLTPRNMTLIAFLSALACLLMLFDFPLPFAPAFYKVDLSEIPVILGGFALNPLAAVIIEILKIVLRLLFKPSDTAYVGELANLMMGISWVVPATWIYLKKKTQKTAFWGMVVGTLCMTLVGGILNYFVLLPMYSVLYQMPLEAIIELGASILPWIDDPFSFVLLATSPFNLFKGGLITVLVVVLYPRLAGMLKK